MNYEYNIQPAESLAFMVRSAQEEYKQAALERRAMQYGLVKQYLWLSALLASGAFSIWAQTYVLSSATVFFLVCSVISSLAALVLAMLCLIGKGMEKAPYDRGWQEYSELCYTLPPESIQQNMLECFDKSIAEAYSLIAQRALKLRRVCRLLICSATTLVIAASLYCWNIHHVQ